MPSNEPPDPIYRFGEFRLIASDRILLRDAERVPLAPRVFNLLLILVENAGRMVTKETLIREIWADSFVEEGNLNQTVSRLRKILGEKADENRFIETVPRVGYRFIADVEIATREEAALNATPPASRTEVAPSRGWLVLALPVALFVVGAVLFWIYRPQPEAVDASKLPSKHTPIRLTDYPTREERPVFTRENEIRFTRWQGSDAMTFIMGADGSNQRRDTSLPGVRTGAWSPDGKKVVFYKEGDESTSVFLANADGSSEIKLPFVPGNMDWSSDSGKLVYQSGKTTSDIFLYTLETGKITTLAEGPGFESDGTLSPDGKSLLYVSDRDGNPEIYIQDLDGSNLRRLTNHPAHDEFPTFSPDGTQIVFNSNREDENFDIYVMNSDGSATRRLTNWKSEEEIRPGCWSADGTQILFVSSKDGKGDVYKMAVEPYAPEQVLEDAEKNLYFPSYSPDGSRTMYAAELPDKSGELHLVENKTRQDKLLLRTENAETFPKFSPDGHSIILQNRINGNAEICLINADGGELRNLTNNSARDAQPAWSPDGAKIAFVSNREGNYDVFSVYIMKADGSDQHRIYYSYAVSGDPAWSPDGKQIVFSNDKEDGRTGNFEIFAIEPETVNPERRLTFRNRYDVQPAFSPNGARIAFVSNTDGNSEIYMMNSDGSALVRLTRDTGDDNSPTWSPDGKKILFSSNRTGKFAIYELSVE